MIPQTDGADTDQEDETESSNDSSNISGINTVNEEYGIRLLPTNARSLMPKLDSLKDAFQSLCLNFASITDTWFKGGSALGGDLIDFEGLTGIKILHKSRDGRRKKTGGGVAIAFDTGSCNLKIRALKHVKKEFEILCVTGRVAKAERTVAIFVVYLPPSMRSQELETLKEGLAVEIGLIKQNMKNPIIIVNGDFNQKDISPALLDVDDFRVLQSGPTRGPNCIDLIFSNADDAFLRDETRILPPL